MAYMADIERIADLLQEAGETHHQVFRITDGADEDWASWYSDWLVNLSETALASYLMRALSLLRTTWRTASVSDTMVSLGLRGPDDVPPGPGAPVR